MIVKITKQIEKTLDSIGNKTKIEGAYKVYAALYSLQDRADNNGYFYVPATYLKAVNARYSDTLNLLRKAGIIRHKQTLKIDREDIFKQTSSKNYSTKYGYCMRYKFLIDFADSEEVVVNMQSGKKKRWYKIIENTLNELGYPSKIRRDTFGRRVHYNLIQNYKIELQNKGLCIIDSQASHPRLLWCLMKRNGFVDAYYNEIFTNNLDFYDELKQQLNLVDRNAAKDLFALWANGKRIGRHKRIFTLFPVVTAYLQELKRSFYKNSAAFLQREEAKIWIDDLLENVPVEFALPVHDSLIIKEQDYETVINYCQTKYPEIRFKRKGIGE